MPKSPLEQLPEIVEHISMERAFIHWAQADAQVHAFCKISENRHTIARLRL